MTDGSSSKISPIEYNEMASFRRKPVASAALSASSAARNPLFGTEEKNSSLSVHYQPIARESMISVNSAGHSPAGTSRAKKLEYKRVRRLWALWKWETASLCVACLSFTAIVIVLRVFQDQDIAKWKAPITINAAIAVLSAIFKGSLAMPISEGISQLKWIWFSTKPRNLADVDRYDRASRSVWGSIVFLATFARRFQLSPIAAFGALLTLLSLAVDPFSQAAVSTQNCVTKHYVSNIIKRAMNFSDTTVAADMVIDPSNALQVAFDSSMTLTLANSSQGMLHNVNCPSTNCTLTAQHGGAFTTLSMCHTCLDVVSELVSTTSNKTSNSNDDPHTTYTYNHTTSDPRHNISTSATIHYKHGWGGPSMKIYQAPLTTSSQVVRRTKQPTRLLADGLWQDTSIAGFQAIFIIPDNQACSNSRKGPFQCDYRPVAVDCALRPCVKTYNASVSRGVYSETETDSRYLHWTGFGRQNSSEPLMFPLPRFEIGLNQTFVNGTLKDCLPQTSPSETHPVPVSEPIDQSIQDVTESRHLWYPKECVHSIDFNTTMAIGFFVFGKFDSVNLASDEHAQNFSNTAAPWLQSLYNNGNMTFESVDTFVSGIANGLGSFIRTANSGQWFNGTTFIPQDGVDLFVPGYELSRHTCICVRWNFLLFPGILLVAALIFFSAVVLLGWRSAWDGNWKSSTLPLLFQGIDLPVPEDRETPSLVDERDLRSAVRGTQARLVPDKDMTGRWSLFTTMEEPKA